MSKVEAIIGKVMAQHPGEGKAALAAYYEAVHQELAPYARQLEQDNFRLRKIAAHVPAATYIAAKEAAGFGEQIKTHNVQAQGGEPNGEASPGAVGSAAVPTEKED